MKDVANGKVLQNLGAIRVFDISGKLIYSENISALAGDNSYHLNLVDKMQAGIYFIELRAGSETITKKLVVAE